MRHRFAALLRAVTLWGCQPPDTRLNFNLEPQANDVVRVTGDTSLPDGAQLNVSLLKPGTEEPIVVDLPVVKESRFEARLDPHTDLPAGTYEVLIEFSPKAFAWSDAVKPAVGENGEKLGGPYVKESAEGFRFLSIARTVRLP